MSGSFNIIERSIATVLSRFPGLKKMLKNTYQRLNYLAFRRTYKWKSAKTVNSYKLEGRETFFGYYDHSPLNSEGDLLLFHSSKSMKKPGLVPEDPEIVVYSMESGSVLITLPTKACNWQQGSRALWLDDDSFIYNDYDAERDIYVSKAYSISKNMHTNTWNFPVYDVKGDVAVSLNFDRLQLLRPDYGYNNRLISPDRLDDANDGLFKCDLKKNRIELLVSLDHMKKIEALQEDGSEHHKINHLMISPDGNKVMYLHRWFRKGVKFHRLMLTSLEDGSTRLLAKGMVSHCTWYGNEKIIGYMAASGQPASYKIIDLGSGKIEELVPGILDTFGDGHPSVFGDRMLFDTYPGRDRMKYLQVLDIETRKVERQGEFYESLDYHDETRCDLHPRWSRDGKLIFFDSVHEGSRCLYSIDYDRA